MKEGVDQLSDALCCAMAELEKAREALDVAADEARSARSRETEAVNKFNEASRRVHAARAAYDKAIGIESPQPHLTRAS